MPSIESGTEADATEADATEADVKETAIFDHINELATEEERLYAKAGDGSGLSATERRRLHEIKIGLDQAYDLLHQREARRAAGQDPDAAEVRPPEVVESYEQ